MKLFRRLLLAISATTAVGGVSMVAAGFYLSEPANRSVRPPPAELAVVDVAIPSPSGSTLAGWFVQGRPHAGAVVLMHGWTSTRRSMLPRMQFLHDAGYSVLAFDFQAHGESPGQRITFGHLESLDAEAATAWMRKRLPEEKIGVIGVSLGGAAALLEPHGFHGDALVLESVFPDMDRAVGDRLSRYIGAMGRVVAEIFVAAIEPIIHVDGGTLRPIDRIHDVGAPVFVIAGTKDTYTTIEETREMFARASEPKQLWEVDGARHVDLERFVRDEYRRRLLDFLGRYLRGETAPVARSIP